MRYGIRLPSGRSSEGTPFSQELFGLRGATRPRGLLGVALGWIVIDRIRSSQQSLHSSGPCSQLLTGLRLGAEGLVELGPERRRHRFFARSVPVHDFPEGRHGCVRLVGRDLRLGTGGDFLRFGYGGFLFV
jgi:hypothetical protein